MKLKIFYSVFLLFLLNNCVGTGTKNLSQLSFQNKPGEASMFFVRPERFVAGGVRIGVFVDGQEIVN